MSVLSYLNAKASAAVLSAEERTSINTSISTLASRLDSYFATDGDKLSSHFRFGSSTRGTILPRSMDAHSDIDYMIVFEKGGLQPQAYLERLKRFVEKRYSTSELYQSSPSVVLELNHIKFDLVPALGEPRNFYSGSSYSIPSGATTWQTTNPNDFNGSLEDKNKAANSLLKPTIRLAKVWNAANGYVFESYQFEKWIKDLSYYFLSNQTQYLFTVFDNLSPIESVQWKNDKINRAKAIVKQVRAYESSGQSALAEAEVKKLLPA